MKIGISICTCLMLNGHSNPYIESTTVLSDIIRIIICAHVGVYISIPGRALGDWLYGFTLFGNQFKV